MGLSNTQAAFEAAAEAAFRSALSGLGPTIYTSEKDTQNIATNRVEIVANVIQLGPHQRVISGSWEYDQAQMRVDVSYVDEPGSSTAPSAAGNAGALRNRITTAAIQSGLTAHTVGSIDLVATTREVDDERNEIALRHSYALMLFVT